MSDQVPDKNKLRKLTEKYCRFRSHFRFLTVCVNEGLVPKGLRVNFGFSALPPSRYLQSKVFDVIKSASRSIVSEVRDTYSFLCEEVKQQLDGFLYDASQDFSFHVYESFLRVHHTFYRHYDTVYWKVKKQKLLKLREAREESHPIATSCGQASSCRELLNDIPDVTCVNRSDLQVDDDDVYSALHDVSAVTEDSQTCLKTIYQSDTQECYNNTLSEDASQTDVLKLCMNATAFDHHSLSISPSSQTFLKTTVTGRACDSTSSCYQPVCCIGNVDTCDDLGNSQSETLLKKPDANTSSSIPMPESQTFVKRRRRANRRFRRRYCVGKYKHDEKSVVNLSTIDLSQEQKVVLGLGPKFCPTPRPPNGKQFLDDVTEGCRKVRLKEFFYDTEDNETEAPRFYKPTGWTPPHGRDVAVDAYCASVINSSANHVHEGRVPNNLNKSLRVALKQLRQLVIDRVIRISKADKGGAVVVQDVSSYIDEAERQLGNRQNYQVLKTDPTVQIAKKSNAIVDKLFQSGHITEQTKKWATLSPNLVRPQQFYHLPKIHKTLVNPPGRPIVSGSGGAHGASV